MYRSGAGAGAACLSRCRQGHRGGLAPATAGLPACDRGGIFCRERKILNWWYWYSRAFISILSIFQLNGAVNHHPGYPVATLWICLLQWATCWLFVGIRIWIWFLFIYSNYIYLFSMLCGYFICTIMLDSASFLVCLSPGLFFSLTIPSPFSYIPFFRISFAFFLCSLPFFSSSSRPSSLLPLLLRFLLVFCFLSYAISTFSFSLSHSPHSFSYSSSCAQPFQSLYSAVPDGIGVAVIER